MNRAESKYFNTAARMDEALIALLETKGVDFITVKELCERAGVNRSTFYLHYETIGDLLRECIEYSNRKCFARFQTGNMEEKIASCAREELNFIRPDFLIPYLEFVRENRPLFKAAMTRGATLNVEETFGRILQNVIVPVLRRFHYPPGEIPYVTAFYIHGLMAIVMEWVRHDCAEELTAVMDVIIKVTVPTALPADSGHGGSVGGVGRTAEK